jgi:hypothetical protein
MLQKCFRHGCKWHANDGVYIRAHYIYAATLSAAGLITARRSARTIATCEKHKAEAEARRNDILRASDRIERKDRAQ